MDNTSLRVLAVDWSGTKGATESIWLAEASAGQIKWLENGRTRENLIATLVEKAVESPSMVVGFDFAFSMPWWFVKETASNAMTFWEMTTTQGESWLTDCPSPFFGQRGKPKVLDRELFRQTEKLSPGAKSTFQINGPGAVGVGSIRGMPFLSKLRAAGWSIWPFDSPGYPLAIEIYPRLLVGKVVKTVWRERYDYLTRQFPDLAVKYLERAAGSEDAFDAAVSALVMDKYRDSLRDLPAQQDDIARLEGRIWRPPDQVAITSNMPLEQQDGVYRRTSQTIRKTVTGQSEPGGDGTPSITERKTKGVAKPCHCGCGEMTGGGTFRPGHDARFKGAMLRLIDEGGPDGEEALEQLRAFPNLVNIRDAEERFGSGPTKRAAKTAKLAEFNAQKSAEAKPSGEAPSGQIESR